MIDNPDKINIELPLINNRMKPRKEYFNGILANYSFNNNKIFEPILRKTEKIINNNVEKSK